MLIVLGCVIIICMEIRQDDLIITKVKLVTGLNTHKLCKHPYPNHPKGCPNYGKKDSCPPKTKIIEKVLDLDRDVYIIASRFEFGKHVEKMRKRHPDWTDRQLRNVLYWQGTARKRLREIVADFLNGRPDLVANFCPEANGVNLTATMKNIGVELEWMPQVYSWVIAAVGYAK